MAEHTTTPWKFHYHEKWPMSIKGNYYRIVSAQDVLLAFVPAWDDPNEGEAEANAKFVLRAVNAHEVLVKALNDLVKACDRYDERPDSDVCVSIYMEARDKARAALALTSAERK